MRVQYWKPFRIFLGKSPVLCRRHQWLHEFRTAEHTPVYDSVLAAGMRRRYVPGFLAVQAGSGRGLGAHGAILADLPICRLLQRHDVS
jgi:hypothetical protein